MSLEEPTSRRSLMRGVAWAAPTAIVAAAAPAIASSSDCIQVDIGVGQSMQLPWDSQWMEILDAAQFVPGTGTLAGSPRTFTPSGSARCANGDGVRGVTGVTNAKVGERDPRVNGAGFSYDRSLCIPSGSYEVTYYGAAYRANPVTAYLRATVSRNGSPLSLSNAPGLTRDITAPGFVDPATGSGINPAYSETNMARTQFGFRFAVSQAGTHTFRFAWSFGAVATDRAGQGRLTPRNSSQECLPTYANDIGVEAPVIRRVA